MRWHDSESHKIYDDEFSSWVIAKIDYETYMDLNRLSKNSGFWKAIRTNPKSIRFNNPLFV
jgi:hypothetical protein